MNDQQKSYKSEAESKSDFSECKSTFPYMDEINRLFVGITLFAFLIISVHEGVICQRSPAVVLLWAIACLAVGATVGFLFGLTKVDQSGVGTTTDNSDTDYKPQINTNLIEISDWLTKIIVGLGLINLKEIPTILKRIALILASCGEDSCQLPLAISIIVGFSIIGFLAGYLNTRTVIALMLDSADRQLKRKVQQLQKRLAKSESDQIANDVINESLQQAISIVAPPLEESSASSDLQTVEPALLKLAEDYEKIKAPTRRERADAKNKFASEILRYILDKKLSKQKVAMWAASNPRDGLIVALAVYILAFPQEGDLEYILEVAAKAKWLHVKFRVTLAFRELQRKGFGNKRDWLRALDILEDYNARALRVNDGPLITVTDEVIDMILKTT